MNHNKVEIIADSKNEHGQRITTAIVTFPRYLLAEVNTHRALTRSSASSRAIRFEKMVESVFNNPFIPMKWQKDHPGMQGVEYFSDFEVGELNLVEDHLLARDYAVEMAQRQNKKGVTKQICNRYLEPFMYHTALITGTEFENFTALRAEGMAEIHFQDVAFKFLKALNESEPKQLKAGEWHIPFGDSIDLSNTDFDVVKHVDRGLTYEEMESIKVKIATVRCARISYKVVGTDQKIDYAADLKLHDRLASSGHWSAFEHCARAMSHEEFNSHYSGLILDATDTMEGYHPQDNYGFGWCGNFRGFIQYRKMFPNENRPDSRLIKK